MRFLRALRTFFPGGGPRPCEACKDWYETFDEDLLGRFNEIEKENNRLVDEVAKITASKTEIQTYANNALRTGEKTIGQKSSAIQMLSAKNVSLGIEFAKQEQLIIRLTEDCRTSAALAKVDLWKARAMDFKSRYEHKRQEIRSLDIERIEAWNAESAAVTEKDAAVEAKDRALRLKKKAEGERREVLQARDQQLSELYDAQQMIEELRDSNRQLRSAKLAVEKATSDPCCSGSSAKTPVTTTDSCDKVNKGGTMLIPFPTPPSSPVTKDTPLPPAKYINTDKKRGAVSRPMGAPQPFHHTASKKFTPQRYPRLDSKIGETQVSKVSQPSRFSSSSTEIAAPLPLSTQTIRGETIDGYESRRKQDGVKARPATASSDPAMPNLLNISKDITNISGGNESMGAASITFLKSLTPPQPPKAGESNKTSTHGVYDTKDTATAKVLPTSRGKEGHPWSKSEPPSVLANIVFPNKKFIFSATSSASPNIQDTGLKPSATAVGTKSLSTSGKLSTKTAASKHGASQKKPSARAMSTTPSSKSGSSSSPAGSSGVQVKPKESSSTTPCANSAYSMNLLQSSGTCLNGNTSGPTQTSATSSTVPRSLSHTAQEPLLSSISPLTDKETWPLVKEGASDSEESGPKPPTAVPESPNPGQESRPTGPSTEALSSQTKKSASPSKLASTPPLADHPASPPTTSPRTCRLNGFTTRDTPRLSVAASPDHPVVPFNPAFNVCTSNYEEHKTSNDQAMNIDHTDELIVPPDSSMDFEKTEAAAVFEKPSIPDSSMDFESTEVTAGPDKPVMLADSGMDFENTEAKSSIPPDSSMDFESTEAMAISGKPILLADSGMDFESTEVTAGPQEASEASTGLNLPAQTTSQAEDTAMNDTEVLSSDLNGNLATAAALGSLPKDTDMSDATEACSDLSSVPAPSTGSSQQTKDDGMDTETTISAENIPDPAQVTAVADDAMANDIPEPVSSSSQTKPSATTDGSPPHTLPSLYAESGQTAYTRVTPKNNVKTIAPIPFSLAVNGDIKQGWTPAMQQLIEQGEALRKAEGPNKPFSPIHVPRISDLKSPNWWSSAPSSIPSTSGSTLFLGRNPSPVPSPYNPKTPSSLTGAAVTSSGLASASLDTSGLPKYARVTSSYYANAVQFDDSGKPDFAEASGNNSTVDQIRARQKVQPRARNPRVGGNPLIDPGVKRREDQRREALRVQRAEEKKRREDEEKKKVVEAEEAEEL